MEKMYDYYNWGEEESKGRNPMVKQRTRLQYFAVLMYSWMKSTPLNRMIINIINYYKKKGEICIRSGAGIVADSVPEKEFEECCNKARAVVQAIAQAQEGLE